MRILLVVLLIATALPSCRQLNARQSAKINDAVIHHQKLVLKSLETFVANLEGNKKTAIAPSLSEINKQANAGINTLSNLAQPDCDEDFIPAAKSMFEYYQSASTSEYEAIASLYLKDSITYGAFDTLQTMLDDFMAKQREVNDAFLSAQKDFAKKCGFKLVQDEE